MISSRADNRCRRALSDAIAVIDRHWSRPHFLIGRFFIKKFLREMICKLRRSFTPRNAPFFFLLLLLLRLGPPSPQFRLPVQKKRKNSVTAGMFPLRFRMGFFFFFSVRRYQLNELPGEIPSSSSFSLLLSRCFFSFSLALSFFSFSLFTYQMIKWNYW